MNAACGLAICLLTAPLSAHTLLLADLSPSVRAFLSLLSILFAFVVFLGVAMLVKRRLFANEEFGAGHFTLADLKALWDQGKLSQQEYDTAKASLLDQLRKQELQKPKKK